VTHPPPAAPPAAAGGADYRAVLDPSLAEMALDASMERAAAGGWGVVAYKQGGGSTNAPLVTPALRCLLPACPARSRAAPWHPRSRSQRGCRGRREGGPARWVCRRGRPCPLPHPTGARLEGCAAASHAASVFVHAAATATCEANSNDYAHAK